VGVSTAEARVVTDRWLRPLGWATLVSNAVLVVTGGAVRLTGSGLGCPTWPRCTDQSFTPHGALDVHTAIEFGNRTLTFVLVAIAIATFVVMWRTGRRDLRTMALVVALGIPAQAVIGGITVLTDLNPWVVSLHLLCSLAIIGVAVRMLLSVDAPLPPAHRGPCQPAKKEQPTCWPPAQPPVNPHGRTGRPAHQRDHVERSRGP